MGERLYDGDDLIGLCAALVALQILIVAARFYTRYMQKMRCGLDDYLILVALVSVDLGWLSSGWVLILGCIGWESGQGYHLHRLYARCLLQMERTPY